MNKLILNEQALERDLENNWAVVAEALQTILRSINYPNPYETLKALTRTNKKIDQQTISEFIDTLEVEDSIKERMRQITPSNYVGVYGKDE
jgi:adenylosuccinate lyase